MVSDKLLFGLLILIAFTAVILIYQLMPVTEISITDERVEESIERQPLSTQSEEKIIAIEPVKEKPAKTSIVLPITPMLPITVAVPEPEPKSDLTIEILFTPKIDEDAIKSAVVRVRCGSTFGSGFVIKRGEKYYVFTAAHVVIDRVEANVEYCDAIFPYKDANGNYREAHYRSAKILDPEGVEKNFKEIGHDIAVLEIIPIPSEDAERFPNGYPVIGYDFCPSDTLGDNIYLFGYAANLGTAQTPGAFLSKFIGNIIQYGDVSGTNQKSSSEFISGFVYTPKIESSLDMARQHPVVIIVSDNNFFGASGGLVFDFDKQCVAGVNFANLVKDNEVYGFSVNLNFEPIKAWWSPLIPLTSF